MRGCYVVIVSVISVVHMNARIQQNTAIGRSDLCQSPFNGFNVVADQYKFVSLSPRSSQIRECCFPKVNPKIQINVGMSARVFVRVCVCVADADAVSSDCRGLSLLLIDRQHGQ